MKTGEQKSVSGCDNERFQIFCITRFSSPRDRKIAELCLQGLNRRQIADFVGLTRQRVWQIIKSYGLDTKPRKLTVNCETCQKPFTKFRSLIVGRNHNFCSRRCSAKARPATAQFPCHVCGTMVPRHPSRRAAIRRVFCSPKCYYAARQGHRYKPSRQGQRIARAVVSKYFTLAPEHVVHHEDRDNRNNAPENLRVFKNQADHMAYHHGNPAAVPLWDGRSCEVPK